MALILTYWEDPRVKRTEDDFDGISVVRLKTVKQIPELIAARPKGTTMISLERTGPKKNFRELWRKGEGSLPPEVLSCLSQSTLIPKEGCAASVRWQIT